MVDKKTTEQTEDSFFRADGDVDVTDMDKTIRHAPAPGASQIPVAAQIPSGAGNGSPNTNVVVAELHSGPNPVAAGMVASMSVSEDLARPTPVAAGPDDVSAPMATSSNAANAAPLPTALPNLKDMPQSIEISLGMPPAPTSPAEAAPVVEAAPPAPSPAQPLTKLLPVVSVDDAKRSAPSDADIAKAQSQIDALVREARAQGSAADAAPLWFEAGWIFEHELRKLREAAAHYEQAHNVDPTFLPVIHATRRLFSQLDKWSMVNILLDKELEIDGAPKASLFFEKARILETKLGKVADAMVFYQKSLDVSPAFTPAVDALSRLQSGQNAMNDVVAMLEKATEASENDGQKLVWLIELARISENQLNDDGKAIAFYSSAREVDPNHGTALTALRRLFRRTNDDNSSIGVLEDLARLACDPTEKVALLFERAQLLNRLGEMEQACAALQQAHVLAPDDTRVLTELTRLYRTLQEDAHLETTYIAQAAASRDRSEKVALLVKAAELAEEKLNAPDRAIAHYSSALELDPTYQPALAAAGRLFTRAHRWGDIARLYEIQLQAAQENSERVPLLFKFAKLLGDKLGEEERAITELRKVLELSSGYVPALKMLSGLFARQERWDDLVGMYESELLQQQDRDQAIYLLDKIGSLYEKELSNPEKAIEAYRRMLDHVPGYLPALRSLGRLYSKTQQWDQLIIVNDEEAEIVGDQNQIVALFHRNGEIYEQQGLTDEAVDAYRRALTLMPNYLPSLKALGWVFSKTQRFEDLVTMHRQEAEVARRAEQRAQLLFVTAGIYEDKIQDQQKAADAYREVLQEVPAFAPAIRALSRISEATGDWTSLVDVLKRQLEGIEDAQDKALVHVRISHILEVHCKDQDAAIRQMEAAIQVCPTLLSAHEQLVRLFEETQDAREEAKAREALEKILDAAHRKVSNQRALAELYLHRLNDPQKSLESLERILVMAPDDAAARRTALKVSLGSRDYETAIRHAQSLAKTESSPAEVANLYLQIAAWQESHLDPAVDGLDSYVRVLQYEPFNPIALRAVERSYVERQCWQGLYQLYEQELVGVDVLSRRADLCMKMGQLAERHLGNNENAIRSYERALNAVPDLLPALERLKELYGRLGRDEDQLKMLALEANASKDPVKAIETLLDVGSLQKEKFNNLDAAVESFQKVLSRDPGHESAFSAVEEIYQQRENHEGLVQLYQARAGALKHPELQAGLLTRVARIKLDSMKDADAALVAFHQVLAISPKNVGTLRTVGDLHYERKEFEQATTLYIQLIAELADPVVIGMLQYRLGVIFSEHLPDPNKAINALTVACGSLSPQTPEYIDGGRRLASAYITVEKFDDARLVLSQLAQSATIAEDRFEFRLELAELLEKNFNDIAAAGEIKKALDVASNEQAVGLLERLTSLYERAQDFEGYLSVASQQAENMIQDDPVRSAQLYQRCADLTFTQLKDAERAMDYARQGLDIDANNISLRAFLADRLSEFPSCLVLAVEGHRRVLRTGNLRAKSILSLFQGWSQQRAHDRTFLAAEVLELLGLADDEAGSFFTDNKSRVQLSSTEVLDEIGFHSWLVHPKNRNVMHEILCVIAGDLGKVNPDDMTEFGVERKDVLKARNDDSLRNNADAMLKMFGGGLTYELHRTHKKNGLVKAIHHHPPVLLVSANVSNVHDDREQKFLIGRKLMALMCGHQLVQHFDEAGFSDFLSAIGKAVDKNFAPLRPEADVAALAKRISSALSRGAKRQLHEPLAELDTQRQRLNLGEFLCALPLTQNRAGLVAGNNLRAAVNSLQAQSGIHLPSTSEARVAAFESDAQLADLICYALSDEYFAARQTLRFAIDA
ncbi:MAG: hypothetical protein GY822_20285 [Deltaproteobacteria bacterium]|nr:hypothetical protein [Deltaproteobacteria bacterium]